VKPAGRVVLVGAGPGDAELLTLKAVRMLRAADVVLHDDLVSADVLARVNPAARIVAVGKRGGCASTPQAFIDQLMIREARAGALVVRLKGGDPFVFGRGGEEMSALRAAGITVDVVNGITAGLAAPAAIGVPLTHRSLAHGVVFVTAHAAGDGEGPDWQLLARCGLTLVIYMRGSAAPTTARSRHGSVDAGRGYRQRDSIRSTGDRVDVARFHGGGPRWRVCSNAGDHRRRQRRRARRCRGDRGCAG
jgi:uroporphyrin-III C-methyltransferase